MSAISVKNVTKSYGSNEVLRGVSFEVEKGNVYSLLGSNGAGKTTLVNILSTLLSVDGGAVEIAGFDLAAQPRNVRAQISLTGQFAAVDDLLTGEENMHMMGSLSRMHTADIQQRTRELLRQFDLEKAAKKRISTYSGGMRRKLDLAISLMAKPPIIFLDEPTTGLDPRSRMELWQLIRELARNDTTILLTTQYLEEADYLADKIGVLNAGKIVAEGTAAELKKQVGSSYAELTFATSAEREKAMRATGGKIEDETLSVAVGDRPEEIRTLLNRLADAGIAPRSMEIRKATLDDVFMKLTGAPQKEEK